MIHHAVSFLGFLIFAGISWVLSSNRRKIAWKTMAWGAALQFLIGLNEGSINVKLIIQV